jgi:hypothetical protein
MTIVAGYQKVCPSHFCAFQESVIRGIVRDRKFMVRRNYLTFAPEQAHGRAHLPRSQAELRSPQYRFILGQNRIRNRKPELSVEGKVEHAAFVSLVLR